MERCSKTSAGATSGIPDGPLVEILSRVPAKSVCRFKCVSKAWRDLIADPAIRKKLRQAMQGLFVQSSDYSMVHKKFSFIDLTVRSVPLDIDPSFSFLTEMTTGIKTFLFDSCNGLVLLGHRQGLSDPRSYTVCNPTTKQWSAVPACGSGKPLTYAKLAFDPDLSSHFHLVQFQLPDLYEKIVSLHVYSSETGTWSQNQIDEQGEQGHETGTLSQNQIDEQGEQGHETGTWSQNQIDEQGEQGQLEGWHYQFTLDVETSNNLCAFVNGFLHVIVIHSDLQRILVVDVQGKARRMITVPGMADGRPEHAFVCYLGQSQGHLHCVTLEYVDNYTNCKLSTWILQDYDSQEWVLKNIVDSNSLDIFGETEETPMFQVVDIHQDFNVVLFLQGVRKLIAYDMDHKEASVIATFKDDKDPWDFARYVPYFSESPDLTNKH